MRHYIITMVLAFAAVAACTAGTRTKAAKAKHSAVVMSYNIRHGVGMDEVTSYERIARVITGCGADVVAVQEVDSVTERSSRADVLDEIARLTGMHHVFARAIPYGGGAYGIGILSKEKPLSVKRVPLPGREEERVLLVVEFGNYYMGCMHLSLTPADQMASLPIIRGVAKGLDKPFFLAGDWNVHPDDPLIASISRDVQLFNDTSLYTFPADKPDEMLDYISVWKSTVAGRNVKAEYFKVLPEPVTSDHRPVVARIEWGGVAKKK